MSLALTIHASRWQDGGGGGGGGGGRREEVLSRTGGVTILSELFFGWPLPLSLPPSSVLFLLRHRSALR